VDRLGGLVMRDHRACDGRCASRFVAAARVCGRTAIVVAVAAPFALWGCAARAPLEDAGPSGGIGAWVCVPVESDIADWAGVGPEWSVDRGAMVSAHGSEKGSGPSEMAVTREEALRAATGSAVAAATELLARRGVRFDRSRLDEIERSATDALLDGGEPTLPRVGIRARLVERCESPNGASTGWRVRVLAEYPIGRLRGDVNNVNWERARLVREAGVLRASAAEFFGEGQWLDGVAELGRAADALASGGFPRVGATDRGAPSTVEGEAEFLRRGLELDLAAAFGTLRLSGEGPGPAVEANGSEPAIVRARTTFVWGGEERGAAGVPVTFDATGGPAQLEAAASTDAGGEAKCVIVAAYGEAGERSVAVSVDGTVAVAAAGEEAARMLETVVPGGAASVIVGASLPFYVVRDGHGTTVCLEVRGCDAADAAVFRETAAAALSADGYAVLECAPGIDVLVTGDLAISASAGGDLWRADVSVELSAIDQSTLRDLGGTTINVFEESKRGRREAEVVALREAGRLAASYLSRRGARSSTAVEKRLDES